MPRRRLDPLVVFNVPFTGGGVVQQTVGTTWYVDTVNGSDGDEGKTFERALATVAEALDRAATKDVIYIAGDIREEVTGSNLKFDITIVGAATRPHHADVPSTGADPGAAVWRPPASPTTATPLITVRGRGWRFVNILFDCPVDAAAVKLERNALSGTSEYDASHASFLGCRFDSGQNAIEDAGGCFNVLIDNCDFLRLTSNTGVAVLNSSTAVALPLNWDIKNSRFLLNDTHIDSPASSWTLRDNVFGTVTATALYIDFTGGQDNMVGPGNFFAGAYEHSDYQDGTNDIWAGNFTSAGVTAAEPAA